MEIKRSLRFLLVLFILTACSNQATQSPSLNPEVISFTPQPKVTDIPPTVTLPTIIAIPNTPTQSPALVDFDNLPKLKDVVLSSLDIENTTDGFDPVIHTADFTNDLHNSCLEDCAKFRFSLKGGSFLTIILSRADNQQEAENLVMNLRESFLKAEAGEFSTIELSSIPPNAWAEYTTDTTISVAPNAWVILDALVATGDFHTSAASLAHGNVIVLVIYSQIYCANTPEYGKICEGDLARLVFQSVDYLNAQAQKLETAGYPK